MSHPLHTYLQIADLLTSGDPLRLTGRTTALAFRYIAEALATPNTPIMVVDHRDDLRSHTHLAQKVQQLIHSSQLIGLGVGRYAVGFVLVYGALTALQQLELSKPTSEEQA